MTTQHRSIAPGASATVGVHVLHDFLFADLAGAIARTDLLRGTVVLTAVDVGKVARVGSVAPYSFYVLRNHDDGSGAPVWGALTGGGGGSSTAAEVSFTPAGGVAATNVQAAIVEVAGDATQALGDAAAAQSSADAAQSDATDALTLGNAHASRHAPGGADPIPPVAPITEAGATRALAASDHGRTILCTAGGGCAIEVPAALPPGFICFVRRRGGAVSFAGSGGLTVTPPSGFLSSLAGAGSGASVYVESATIAALDGDLAS